MATYATLTVNAEDIIGADFDKHRASAWIEAGGDDGVLEAIKVDNSLVRIGGRRESPDSTGTITFSNLVTTNSAANPTSFFYRVRIVYTPKGSRRQGHDEWTSAWFPLTGNANLANIDAAFDNLTAPITWRGDFLDQAQSLLAQQTAIAGLTGEDAAIANRVNTSGSQTRAALDAVVPDMVVKQRTTKLVRTSGRLASWGHSYQFGIGASDNSKRFARLLADHYRLDEVNEAVSGTTVSSDASGSSFGKFLQVINRQGGGAVPGSGATQVAASGYTTPRGVYDFFYGINDLAVLGNTLAVLEPVTHAFRSMISRARAGVVYENTSSLVAYSGTDWTATTTGNAHSGAGYHYTSTNGAAVQVALPADFPGGTIAIGIVVPSGVGAGGRLTTNSIPDRTETYDAYNTRTGSQTGEVWRIENVPAGARTIFITVSAISNFVGFDYLQWEAPNADSPLVVMHKQPYPVDYSAYSPGPFPTNAGVDVLNGIITSVAAEFGDRVLVVDHSSMNGDATMFAGDKLHPSDLGNRRIFTETVAAITAAGFVIEGGRAVTKRYDYGTAAPTGTRTYYNVGDYVENTAPVVSNGMYVAGWLCTTAGRPATWSEDRRLSGTPVVEASGSATMNATFGTTNITHGLPTTPTCVVLTARTAGVALGCTVRNGTAFTVARTDTTAAVTFDWYARA